MNVNIKLDKIDEEKKIKELRRNLLSKTEHDIPPYEKFTMMNFIPIGPRRDFSKAGANDLNNENNETEFEDNLRNDKGDNQIVKILLETNYERRIRKLLRAMFNDYFNDFENICKEVIENKYQKIFEEIFHFTLFIKYCHDQLLPTIIINTDQNANDFFDSMEDFFKEKFNLGLEDKDKIDNFIVFVPETKFRDIKSLFQLLEICDDRRGLGDSSDKKKERLIVLREIQKIDKLNLNILIGRLIAYNLDTESIYKNVLIFDVSYDPRGLFEKIKPDHLCKMSFSNVENIPSKNIYQEVLYKFIYENKKSIFIPNSVNLKRIVSNVNNHQISVKSFKHYFKFLLIDFFLIETWAEDEFLIYSAELIKKSERHNNSLEKFFSGKLKEIYGVKSKMISEKDSRELCKVYIMEKLNKSVFFTFYKFLEDLVSDLYSISNKKEKVFDKYQFFFEFLQCGWNFEASVEHRVNLIENALNLSENDSDDIIEITKNLIIPKIKDIIKQFTKLVLDADSDSVLGVYSDPNKSPLRNLYEDKESLNLLLKNLEGLFRDKVDKKMYQASEKSKQRDRTLVHNIKDDEDLPVMMSRNGFLKCLVNWFKRLFELNFFSYMENNNDRKVSLKNSTRVLPKLGVGYHIFSEIVNPSLSQVVVDFIANLDILLLKSEEKNKNKNKKTKSNLNLLIEELEQVVVEERITNENFDKNFKYVTLFKHYLLLFSSVPTEFRLKFLFIEYLKQFEVDFENKERVEVVKNVFLYFSHIFYLLGYISKKTVKNDVYVKNYFRMNNYFDK